MFPRNPYKRQRTEAQDASVAYNCLVHRVFRYHRGRDEDRYPMAKIMLLATNEIVFEQPGLVPPTTSGRHGRWRREGSLLVIEFHWRGDQNNLRTHIFHPFLGDIFELGFEQDDLDPWYRQGNPRYHLLPWIE